MPIPRSDLILEARRRYEIPLFSWRAADIAVTVPGATSGDHNLTEGTNVLSLDGNAPSSSTVTDISWNQWQLPPEYVGGGAISFVVSATVDVVADAHTVDLSLYRNNSTSGAVGSDLCATAAQAPTATATEFEFVITPATLAPGDLITLKLTTTSQDADGANGVIAMHSTAMLLDIKG